MLDLELIIVYSKAPSDSMDILQKIADDNKGKVFELEKIHEEFRSSRTEELIKVKVDLGNVAQTLARRRPLCGTWVWSMLNSSIIYMGLCCRRW